MYYSKKKTGQAKTHRNHAPFDVYDMEKIRGTHLWLQPLPLLHKLSSAVAGTGKPLHKSRGGPRPDTEGETPANV